MRLIPGLLVACLTAGSLAQPVKAAEVTRYVRFADGGTAKLGQLEGGTIHVLSGSLFGAHKRTGETRALAAVRLLPPVVPRKVLAVGASERRGDARANVAGPELFAKLPTSVIGPGDPIPFPPDASDLHAEGALVVVIAKRARNIPADTAAAHVFGVTAGHDVGERGWQAHDLQWLRARASDGFAPIGPVLVRGLDWRDLTVETRLNGKLVQQSTTAKARHSVAEVVSFASRYVTLEPGDIIFMGAPGSTGPIKHGDVVEVEIAGIGVLRNPVAAAPLQPPPTIQTGRHEMDVAHRSRRLRRDETTGEGVMFLWAAAGAIAVGAVALLFVLMSISPARIARAVHQMQRQPRQKARDKEIDSS
ncbi:MAG: fumarylacetoacetate hydrolase family protein [Methyloligellaceae bacterium]